MNRKLYDFWVGLFVAMTLAALAFLALRVSNSGNHGSAASYQVSANFDNIGGLKVRAPVKSAGVVVGRVANIELNKQSYQATVTMQLEQQFQFPKDSSAEILTSGILGEQYIGIGAGGDDAMLKDGDKLTLTSSAVVLEKLISQFMFSKAADNGATTASPPAQ